MDLPRLEALNAYWRNNPPLHLLVKAFVGYQGAGTTSGSPAATDTPDLMQTLEQFPQGMM